METDTILSENIKAYRKSLGITSEELAGLVGISRQSLQMHQSGKRKPTSEHTKKYAEVFGVTLEQLESTPHPDTWGFIVFNKITWLQAKP
ncbi:MAG TPA: helix-turn-helix transcriptional regulator [Oculatellaceae cyanobacterium]